MSTIRVRTAAMAVVMTLAIALAGLGPLAAQVTGTIRGRVVDAMTQRPLARAQVSVVGMRIGGLTNANGQFLILNVPAGTRTVRTEIIGYGTQEQEVTVTASEVAVVDFTLSQQAIDLEEVVVTGVAGRTQKRAIGNAVSTVQAAQVTELAPIQNVTELLTARAPGLTLMQNGGEAGAGSKIRIRGAGSMNANLAPVIYVDGIRIESGLQGNLDSGWGGSQASSPLDAINPDDIETIEVIKGPAAATLYGADAAGGVIQIITKKGQAGSQGIRWTVQSKYGQTAWATVDQPTNYWLCQDSNIDNPTIYPGCSGFTKSQPLEQRLLSGQPVKTDPAALRVGDLWGLDIAASGGGQGYNYYISFEQNKEQGVFRNNFANRTGGRANFGFVPSETMNFQVNVGYTRTHNRMPLNNNASNGILRNGYRGRAGAMDDPWKPGWRGFSPELSNEYNQQARGERFIIGTTINYNPRPWLTNRLTVGLDRDSRSNEELYQIDTTGRKPWGSTNSRGRIQRNLPVSHRWSVDYSGSAAVDVSENYTSTFSAGVQLNRRQFASDYVEGTGLVANQLNLVNSAVTTTASQSFSEQTSLGFYLQERVAYKDKLYATAAVRVDDNSAFGRNFSLVIYPKASLSYVVSDEDWFDFDWVDQFKLRTAWGQAGNAPAPFSADRTFVPGTAVVSDAAVNRLTFGAYGNPDLKAETGQELELGFEASLFDGRMGVDFTFYDQRTKDALISVPDPPSSGYSGSHLTNVGEVLNRGAELLVTTSPIHSRTLEWNSTVALSFSRNELLSFGRFPDGTPVLEEFTFGAFASVQRHREGYPLAGFWSVDVARDANGVPILDGTGNVTLENSCRWAPSDPAWTEAECDETYRGPMLPTRELAFSNTFTLFGNLTIFANLDYKGGNYQWCAMCSIRNRIDRNSQLVNTPNPDPAMAAEILAARTRQTAKWIQPADFVKLREVSLTYSLPSDVTSRIGADRAAITLSGRNLWYWTKYRLDDVKYDPEVSFYSLSAFTQLDYASMPMMRRWSLSMRVGF